MNATHWTIGHRRRWRPALKCNQYRTVCGRWLTLDRTTTPDRVTCKQCRRHLDLLEATP